MPTLHYDTVSTRAVSGPLLRGFAGLPVTPTSFVGRDGALAEIAELLASERLLTLTGAAGVGKTRLATEYAAGHAACHEDEVRVVDLDNGTDTGTDRESALGSDPVAVVCGAILGRDRAGIQDVVAAYAGTSALVVLDTCDRRTDACAQVVEALLYGCPRLRLIATSRQPLGALGEALYVVAPLSPEAAIQLFLDRVRARSGRPVTEVTPVVETICRDLDHLPLAVELAANRATVLSPAQIAERLDDRFGLLTGGSRTGPARHRSLRAAIDWGYAQCSESGRVLLRRLAVFADGFFLDGTEAVCADDATGDVLDALDELVARSFVGCDTRGSEARYSLTETVRHYALDRLAVSGEEEPLRLRHAEHHARVVGGAVDSAGVGDLAGVARVERTGRDPEAALAWCRAQGHHASALALAGVLVPLWLMRGRLHEGASVLGGLLADTDDLPAGGSARLGLGALRCALGAAEEAGRLAVEAQQQVSGDAGRLQAAIVSGAAQALSTQDHGCADLAALVREVTDRTAGVRLPWQTFPYALLGYAQSEAGDLVTAQQTCERGIAHSRDADCALGLVANTLALGHVVRLRGDFGPAEELLTDALDRSRALDLPYAQSIAHRELAELADDRGGYDQQARVHLRSAIDVAAAMDAPLLLIPCLDLVGRVRLREGEREQARQSFVQLIRLSRRTTSRHVAVGLLGLCAVALRSETPAAAWPLLDEATDIAREAGSQALLARCLHARGELAEQEGDLTRAWSAYQQALDVRAQAGLVVTAIESLDALARLAGQRDDEAFAVRLAAAAQGNRGRLGIPTPPRVKSTVDDKAFDEAWAQGAGLSLADAVSYAGRNRGPRQRGVGWVSLTRSERAVAQHVEAGRTNREIGAQLFISPRTVQAHLSHVYAKLGIRSRKELTREVRSRTRHSTPAGPDSDGPTLWSQRQPQ